MIEVRYNEFYNMEEVVPVTVLEDKKIVWCNHAISDNESVEFTTGSGTYEERAVTEAIEVCRKCQSWRFVGEEKWRGAYE